MKKFTAILLAVLTLLSLSACAVGGGGEDPGTSAGETENDVEIVLCENFSSQYTIIYPEKYHFGEGKLFFRLFSAMGGSDIKGLKTSDDWLRAGQTEDEAAFEILIGATNRSASVRAAELLQHPKDYCIAVFGNKIAIYSEDTDILAEAMEYLIAHIAAENGRAVLTLPEHCYKAYSYPCGDLTIGGRPVADYCIVIPDGSGTDETRAEKINAWFIENCGVELPVRSASEAASECEILLGRTGRAESAAYFPAAGEKKVGYTIELKGTKLVTAYDSAGGRAVDALVSAVAAGGKQITALSIVEEKGDYETFRYDNFAAGRLSDALLDSVNPGVLALLSECMYYEYKLKEAISKGEKWVYSNSGSYVKQSGTFDQMIASGLRGGNCSMPQAWAQVEMGIVLNGSHLYGGSSGNLARFDDLGKYICPVADITSWDGTCKFSDLFNAGEVKPGDIFFVKAHTFIYLGDNKFMAAGHDGRWHSDETAKTDDERKAVFDDWIRPINDCSNWNCTIYWQERFKDEYIPKYYRNAAGELVENPMYSPQNDIQYKPGKSPEYGTYTTRTFTK